MPTAFLVILNVILPFTVVIYYYFLTDEADENRDGHVSGREFQNFCREYECMWLYYVTRIVRITTKIDEIADNTINNAKASTMAIFKKANALGLGDKLQAAIIKLRNPIHFNFQTAKSVTEVKINALCNDYTSALDIYNNYMTSAIGTSRAKTATVKELVSFVTQEVGEPGFWDSLMGLVRESSHISDSIGKPLIKPEKIERAVEKLKNSPKLKKILAKLRSSTNVKKLRDKINKTTDLKTKFTIHGIKIDLNQPINEKSLDELRKSVTNKINAELKNNIDDFNRRHVVDVIIKGRSIQIPVLAADFKDRVRWLNGIAKRDFRQFKNPFQDEKNIFEPAIKFITSMATDEKVLDNFLKGVAKKELKLSDLKSIESYLEKNVGKIELNTESLNLLVIKMRLTAVAYQAQMYTLARIVLIDVESYAQKYKNDRSMFSW